MTGVLFDPRPMLTTRQIGREAHTTKKHATRVIARARKTSTPGARRQLRGEARERVMEKVRQMVLQGLTKAPILRRLQEEFSQAPEVYLFLTKGSVDRMIRTVRSESK
jgi:hypothetical protein